MITSPSITIQSIINTIMSFMLLFGLVAVIISNEKLYCRVRPSAIIIICIISIVRVAYPFSLPYGHTVIYRGVFRHLVMIVNRSWNSEGVFKYFSVIKVFFFVWMIGAVIKIIRMIVNHRKAIKYIKLFSKEVTDEITLENGIDSDFSKYILKHKIKLFKSDKINTPLCCGLISTMIMIPDKGGINEKHVRVILAHELTHIRQGDLVKKAALIIARLIYWWFPPFDKLCRYIDLAVEMQTDKKASVRGKGKTEYLESLVEIMEIMGKDSFEENNAQLHPVSFFSVESEMSKRVKRLISKKRESFIISTVFILAALFVYASSYLFSISALPTYEEQKEMDISDGVFTPNATNTKIIKKNNNEYEIQITFSEDDVFTYIQPDLFGYTNDIPLYNEKGERIKWPFFERLQ